MAIHAVYRKSAETPTTLTYLYGSSTDHLNNQVVINKVDSPVDNSNCHLEMAVVTQILRRFNKDGTWPTGGRGTALDGGFRPTTDEGAAGERPE